MKGLRMALAASMAASMAASTADAVPIAQTGSSALRATGESCLSTTYTLSQTYEWCEDKDFGCRPGDTVMKKEEEEIWLWGGFPCPPYLYNECRREKCITTCCAQAVDPGAECIASGKNKKKCKANKGCVFNKAKGCQAGAWESCSNNSDCASGNCAHTTSNGDLQCCPSGSYYCYAWTSGGCKTNTWVCNGKLGN